MKHIYHAGIHAPPTSVSGEPLPGSRLISIVMFPDVPIPDPVWTLITMTWGQIVTHDMSMSMGTTQASKCTRLQYTCNLYNHKRYSGILYMLILLRLNSYIYMQSTTPFNFFSRHANELKDKWVGIILL